MCRWRLLWRLLLLHQRSGPHPPWLRSPCRRSRRRYRRQCNLLRLPQGRKQESFEAENGCHAAHAREQVRSKQLASTCALLGGVDNGEHFERSPNQLAHGAAELEAVVAVVLGQFVAQLLDVVVGSNAVGAHDFEQIV